MTNIQWIQHAVGQGGFLTGNVIQDQESVFNWVYDCGAKNFGRFHEYLDHWLSQNSDPIDWLFISHFDFDHVNGLDKLLTRAEVRNVMIPILSNGEILLVLLKEIYHNNLSASSGQIRTRILNLETLSVKGFRANCIEQVH